MKSFNSLLTIGALLAFAGSVVAAPVPDAAAAPVPARETRVVWHTVTHVKVVGVTKTQWVDPPTSTPETTTTETSSTTEAETTTTTEEETTTTTTTTSSTTTSSTTTSTTESTTEEDESTTSTTTTSTTSSTTSSTTTEEETSTTETPTPTPPKPTIHEITINLPTPTPEPTPEPKPEPEPQPVAPPTSEWEGDATYYTPGQGSCGFVNTESDMIAAISHVVLDLLTPNGNPNLNPLCGKKIRCTRDGKNPTVITVVDRCPVCSAGDLDLSPAAYAALGGTIAEGRFKIQCSWL